MFRIVSQNIIRFVLLVLLQVLVLNNIQLGGLINPYAYVLVILSLPIETPRWLTLLVGVVLGLSIDVFTRTLGMHMTATVFLAFLRPIVLQYMAPRDGYEYGTTASIRDHGYLWYLTYAGILILLHHLFLFFVEAFEFENFFRTGLKAILSSLVTLVLVVILQMFTVNRKQSQI